MEIGEIIMDALQYPLNNVKALVIYVALGILGAIVLAVTGAAGFAAIGAKHAGFGILTFVGLIVMLIIELLIMGYGLDVIKIGINRENASPGIDIARQVINGIKMIIVAFVYLIIPVIIIAILNQINTTLGAIVGLILLIIFSFALFMGMCRLANTESLGEALNISEAIKDISKVGVIKILAIIICTFVIQFILLFIAGLFLNLGDVGTFISAILMAIVNVYMTFVTFRADGLLYSDAA